MTGQGEEPLPCADRQDVGDARVEIDEGVPGFASCCAAISSRWPAVVTVAADCSVICTYRTVPGAAGVQRVDRRDDGDEPTQAVLWLWRVSDPGRK